MYNSFERFRSTKSHRTRRTNVFFSRILFGQCLESWKVGKFTDARVAIPSSATFVPPPLRNEISRGGWRGIDRVTMGSDDIKLRNDRSFACHFLSSQIFYFDSPQNIRSFHLVNSFETIIFEYVSTLKLSFLVGRKKNLDISSKIYSSLDRNTFNMIISRRNEILNYRYISFL